MTFARKLLVYGVLLTVVPLVVVGFASWRVGQQAQTAAQDGTARLARADLDHIVQLVYLASEATAKAVQGRDTGTQAALPDKAAIDGLLNKLMGVKIGRTGYIYILSTNAATRGAYVLSLGRKRDGENIWAARDTDGRLFIQAIINQALTQRPDDTGEMRYPWKNANDPVPMTKVVRFKYFPAWEWVIAAGIPENELFATANEVEQLNRHATVTVTLLTAIALVLSSLVWWLFSRKLSTRLGPMIAELLAGAHQVVSASGQVSTSALSLSQGATEQAAALEETSASMEEMASMTRRNAENSQSAAGLMTGVDARVHDASQALGEMVGSMAAIQESSRKVAKIIKTIDEIAFHTNILALNAAVEAARAGEAGMGFAVVADEVRNLAQRSAQAAKNTADLIEESITRAQDGRHKVDQVEAAIAGMTASVTEVKRLVEEVSVASQQQAQGLHQVSQAVAQMEKVTQSTAATAEESAAASEELNAQAETTMQTVGELNAFVGARDGEAPISHASPAPREHPVRPPGQIERTTAAWSHYLARFGFSASR
jgi:hypothetical protein